MVSYVPIHTSEIDYPSLVYLFLIIIIQVLKFPPS